MPLLSKVYDKISQNETANCYIVTEAGNYKFQTVQGNSSTSVGVVASVAVPWESFGTNVTPSVGDLVNTVSVDGDYIVFLVSNKKGNAVIAANDGSNNILWSWHIWLTAQPSDHVYNNNAGIGWIETWVRHLRHQMKSLHSVCSINDEEKPRSLVAV